MSQEPNPYHAGYPTQQPGYPPQQPGGYPPQQFGEYPGYPPQQPGNFNQNQMPYQPPPVVPRPDFPKDDEQGGTGGEWGNFQGLDSKEIRRVFIRKVYSILMVQLLVTFGFIAICHFTPTVRDYVRGENGRWLYIASYVTFLVTYLALVCSKNAARRFPLNMILLGILTLAMSFMMGMISTGYKGESVLMAVGITAFVCLGVTLFSFQKKYDFTNCFGILFVISLALLAFGFVCIFSRSDIMYKVYAGLGAIAFSIFLAVDTQLIVGGKRHEISAEDHVFASIMLYLDVVYIFLYILQLLGQRE